MSCDDSHLLPNASQLAHNVVWTLLRHRFKVLTSFQRPYDVVLTSCTCWDTTIIICNLITKSALVISDKSMLLASLNSLFDT